MVQDLGTERTDGESARLIAVATGLSAGDPTNGTGAISFN